MVSPIPVYSVNPEEAGSAYEAYAAMRRMAQAEPHLAENEYFKALQDTAYARFLSLFEALS